MKPGTGEPSEMPWLRFRVDGVETVSPPPRPTTVVQAGQNVEFKVHLGVEGFWAGLLVGEKFKVGHHLERVEDGVRTLLFRDTFKVPGGPDTQKFYVTTGSFTTGQAGEGRDLEVAPGFATATFHVVTHIHFEDPNKEPIIAGFHDMFLMIT